MTIKTSSYRQSLLNALLDPVEASAYLYAALEDSPEAFLKALKNNPGPSDGSSREAVRRPERNPLPRLLRKREPNL
jgi:hypothetical protein